MEVLARWKDPNPKSPADGFSIAKQPSREAAADHGHAWRALPVIPGKISPFLDSNPEQLKEPGRDGIVRGGDFMLRCRHRRDQFDRALSRPRHHQRHADLANTWESGRTSDQRGDIRLLEVRAIAGARLQKSLRDAVGHKARGHRSQRVQCPNQEARTDQEDDTQGDLAADEDLPQYRAWTASVARNLDPVMTDEERAKKIADSLDNTYIQENLDAAISSRLAW